MICNSVCTWLGWDRLLRAAADYAVLRGAFPLAGRTAPSYIRRRPALTPPEIFHDGSCWKQEMGLKRAKTVNPALPLARGWFSSSNARAGQLVPCVLICGARAAWKKWLD